MSADRKTRIWLLLFEAALFVIGGGFIYHAAGWGPVVGVVLMIWANNMSRSRELERLRSVVESIIKVLQDFPAIRGNRK